jgi:ABC-type sugar transport system permease subunit
VYGVGLRNIPDDVLEAAELDGASPWQRLRYVVLPMMKPLILFTVIIATIIFFNVFAPVYVLTASAQGAPAYDFKVVVGEIYQNAFVFYRMGYAGAQSVVLLLFVLSLVFLQFFVFRDKLTGRGRPMFEALHRHRPMWCTACWYSGGDPFF